VPSLRRNGVGVLMSEISIPMNGWSKEGLRDGRKTATTRTERYGEPGDRFTVEFDDGVRQTYVLTHVVKIPLETVAEDFYDEEGAESPTEFKKVWEDIHYKKGYVADWRVYLHLFCPVGVLFEDGGSDA